LASVNDAHTVEPENVFGTGLILVEVSPVIVIEIG